MPFSCTGMYGCRYLLGNNIDGIVVKFIRYELFTAKMHSSPDTCIGRYQRN